MQDSLKNSGVFDLSFFGSVKVAGPSARDFLQRMSTTDFRKAIPGKIAPGAFLTGRAGVVAIGFFEALDAETFLFYSAEAHKAAEHLERFHFSENLSISMDPDWVILAFFQRPIAKDTPIVSSWQDPRIKALRWARVKTTDKESVLSANPCLPVELFTFLRLNAGIPPIGPAWGDSNIVLEAELDWLLDREKGCYPGQEVVERIFTYGQVNRKIFPVRFPLQGGGAAELPFPLYSQGQLAGEMIAWTPDPTRENAGVGLALIRKNFWGVRTFSSQLEEAASFEVKRNDGANLEPSSF